MDRNEQSEQLVPIEARARWGGLQLVDGPGGQDPEQELVNDAGLFKRPVKEVLFVDPSVELQQTVKRTLHSMAVVHVCSTFSEACSRLVTRPPDLLVTAVRLQAHNGLHLVYLAARTPWTRCVVHVTPEDYSLAREVEAAGAFMVREPWLAVALSSFVTASLPYRNRRDNSAEDRRRMPRGGRRCTDSKML
jgi:DNA-binding NtrC family response regulator